MKVLKAMLAAAMSRRPMMNCRYVILLCSCAAPLLYHIPAQTYTYYCNFSTDILNRTSTTPITPTFPPTMIDMLSYSPLCQSSPGQGCSIPTTMPIRPDLFTRTRLPTSTLSSLPVMSTSQDPPSDRSCSACPCRRPVLAQETRVVADVPCRHPQC